MRLQRYSSRAPRLMVFIEKTTLAKGIFVVSGAMLDESTITIVTKETLPSSLINVHCT
jgi:hypothetical protein